MTPKTAKITSDTLIPIGLAAALLSFTWYMAVTVSGVKADIATANKELTEALPAIRRTFVSRAEVESWISLLGATNSSLSFPPLPNYGN